VLVADDAEVGALAGELEDGADEVLAGGAVDPASAEDEVRDAGGGDGELAGELAAAVDIEGVGGVGLDVGRGFGAVEDVVGGEVYEDGAEGFGFGGEDFRCGGVEGEGEVGFGLGLVDGGVGGGVDDPAGLDLVDDFADGCGIGEVELGAGGREELAEGREGAGEGLADLAGDAGDEDAGGIARGHSLRLSNDYRASAGQRLEEGG
jgi:hypothetical protein